MKKLLIRISLFTFLFPFAILIPSLLFLYWYSEKSIEVPQCKSELINDKRNSNAGCIIVIDNKALFVKQAIGRKLSLPGGTKKPNETAPCTAARETFEETGIDVIVKKQLKKLNNSFIVYQCQPINTDITNLNLKYRKFLEISTIKINQP